MSATTLKKLLQPPFAQPGALTKREQAEDLFFEAMDAPSATKREKFLAKVLELDPEHSDARLYLLGQSSLAPVDCIVVLRDIVTSAQRRLGMKAFREMTPHFWSHLETRPYMRARAALASALVGTGRREEAVAEYAGMLDLNENDNQGVRHTLLCLLLELSRPEAAGILLKRYKDDDGVAFGWCRILERHVSGEIRDAENALAAARKNNPNIERYLTGQEPLPKQKPEMYTIGSVEEAAIYAEDVISAWNAFPKSIEWLKSHQPAGLNLPK